MAKVTTALGDFSFVPVEAQAPMRETLSWFNDIVPTYNGNESAVSLRDVPRQKFEIQCPVRYVNTQEFFNTAYGSQIAPWIVPAWGEAQFAGTLSAGATGAAVGNAAADLREGALALLWGSGGMWLVVQLATVAPAAITFSALATTVPNAYVIPLRQARVSRFQRKGAGHDSRWSLDYDVEDNIDLAPTAPTQYLGNDIYFDVSLGEDDGIDETIFTEINKNDFDVGRFVLNTPWNNPRITRSHGVICNGPAECWSFRQWLHRRQGRYRKFWQPTFQNDFVLAQTGTIVSTLTVKNNNWSDFATGRVHIAIQTTTGWLARQITGAVVIGDNVALTLSSAININTALVKTISYLGLRRLDTDDVELNWVGGGVCESSIQVVELTP